jgi:hypothetical protein
MKSINEYKKRFYNLMESTMGDAKPLISEQGKPIDKINLANGNYIGDGSGYEYEILDLNKINTGYRVKATTGIRGMKNDDKVTISNGIPTSQTWGVGGTYSFEDSGYKPQPQSEQKVVSSKLSQGIQNVLPQMVQSPPFKGNYSGYGFGGNFNGVEYQWDGSGVSGMSGIRGEISGVVLTENNSYLIEKGITDADPNGTWVGFASDNGSSKFGCYKTTEGTIKCVSNPNL